MSQEVYPTLASLNISVPQLCLVFDSTRHVLSLEGFPSLMREKAEFLEMGKLKTFTCTKFIDAVQRYGNINQRMGL